MKISMKLDYQYMEIFFIFPPTSNHVVDENDNGKFRPQRVNPYRFCVYSRSLLCKD